MLNKELCEKLWKDIINECDKQINKYKDIKKRSQDNLKTVKNEKCTECEKNLNKSYEEMIHTCDSSIENWKKQKNKALSEIKKCNELNGGV